jgi:hypothetical protein
MGNCGCREVEPTPVIQEENKIISTKAEVLELVNFNLTQISCHIESLTRQEKVDRMDRLVFLKNSIRDFTPLIRKIEDTSRLDYGRIKQLFEELFENMKVENGYKENYSISFYKLKDSIETGFEEENRYNIENGATPR